MTTMNISNISHKRVVPTKYMPNSYRIFCEEISNDSLKDDTKYSSQAPPLFTQPMIVPAQAIEDRNRPHGGRTAAFLRENAHTLNEPVNRVETKNVNKDLEKRWWEWNQTDDQQNQLRRKRSQSTSTSGSDGTDNGGFQTTYQKDHGYMKNHVRAAATSNPITPPGAQSRHSTNPNTTQAIGIVPINDLNGFTKANDQQRVYVDKMSFEHAYDSRKENNYPDRGRRQGAYVLDQLLPRPEHGLKSREDRNKNVSLWDIMHPENTQLMGNQPPRTQIYQRPPTENPDVARNQRRDPIGYFDDTKYGGSLRANNQQASPSPVIKAANTQQDNARYQPSWTAGNSPVNGVNDQPRSNPYDGPNELLDQAMSYQQQNGGSKN